VKILLISDLPPCTDYSGPLLTQELCGYLPDDSIYAFIVKNRILTHIGISPELKLADKNELIKPFENSLHLKFGRNPVVNFVHQSFHKHYTIKKLFMQVNLAVKKNKIDKIWIILQGQTMINLARYIIEHSDVPLYSQVWDNPKWWLIDNKINKVSSRAILRNFDFVIKNSTACGVASENMAEEYTKKYGTKCYILIPTLDESLVTKSIRAFDEKQITIGMCGQLYAAEEWASLISALDSVNWTISEKPVTINYVGYSLANNLNPHIINHGYKTQEELFKILNDCDIQYCPYIINEKFKDVSKYSFPSKVVTYLATNRPIFYHGPSYSSPAKLVVKNNIGIICESLATADILKGLNSILSTKESYTQMQKNMQKVYANEFTSEKLKNNFLQLLDVVKKSNF